MNEKLISLEEMLAVDGYTLTIERTGPTTDAVIRSGDGICEDCLVPKTIMTGMLAQALEIEADSITLTYPSEL